MSDSIGHRFILSALSASFAEFVTFPIDLTKTRLQIQGEYGIQRGAYRGLIGTAIGIVKEEGFIQLWAGVQPAILRHIVYSGARMTIYEIIRQKLMPNDGHFPMHLAVLTGLFAGGLGQLIANPTDLVKVRMQLDGRRELQGLPKRYKSTWHAFQSIIKMNGIKGLWTGWIPNVQRAALVNLGDLTAYNSTKQYLLKHGYQDNSKTHVACSFSAALTSAIIGSPSDVLKTRLMNQPTDKPLYNGLLDCLRKTIDKEGVFALWKGFVPNFGRMLPWSVTFWIMNEKLRSLTGASSF